MYGKLDLSAGRLEWPASAVIRRLFVAFHHCDTRRYLRNAHWSIYCINSMRRRLGASIAFTLLLIGSCCALRSLQQNEADVALLSQGPVAAEKSNIQLNAPGTSNLLGAPALAPANGPLPAGIVSLTAKRNSNSAATADAQDTLQGTQQTYATITVPVWPPALPHQRQHGTLMKAEAC